MYIPTIYLLFSAEILFILLAFSTGLLIYVYKLSQRTTGETEAETLTPEVDEAFDLSTSYAEYIEQEMQRNQEKLQQQSRIESEDAADTETNEAETTADNTETDTPSDETGEQSAAPDESQSQLLAIREMFLEMEKSAAEYNEHEIHFWEQIYKGMESIAEKLTTVIHKEHKKTEMDIAVNESPEVKEKVFYIETQGKKVDGEVNKLKDIIYEQENAINALRKSVGDAGSDVEQSLIDDINNQIAALETQLSDSKMCMEVLEMENNRLQEEVSQLEAQYLQQLQSAPAAQPPATDNSDSTIDLSELQDLVDKQESQIHELNSTIDELKMDAQMATKMKETISDFAHSSQEMMGCISILEDENQHFKQLLEQQGISADDAPPVEPAENNADVDELKSQLQAMEEEIIKKDVAYAQLQEEFDSMEKEYLSMYEALHGDND